MIISDSAGLDTCLIEGTSIGLLAVTPKFEKIVLIEANSLNKSSLECKMKLTATDCQNILVLLNLSTSVLFSITVDKA